MHFLIFLGEIFFLFKENRNKDDHSLKCLLFLNEEQNIGG